MDYSRQRILIFMSFCFVVAASRCAFNPGLPEISSHNLRSPYRSFPSRSLTGLVSMSEEKQTTGKLRPTSQRGRKPVNPFARSSSTLTSPGMAIAEVAEYPRRPLIGLRRMLWKLKNPSIPQSINDEGRFLLLASLVGLITGTAVTVFKTMIGSVKRYSYGDLVGIFPVKFAPLVAALVPVLGGAGVVLLKHLMALKSFGPGLSGLTEEVDRQTPWNPARIFGKSIAAVLTLGTGNSLGPEGPAVELGVAGSRYVSSWGNLSVERQRMLLGAGAAAGVAAGFNAPIAGVFFALEIVKDTLSTNNKSKPFVAATLLCAAVSALVAKVGLHDELSLRPSPYNLESPLIELPLYLGLGAVAGLVAIMFKIFCKKV